MTAGWLAGLAELPQVTAAVLLGDDGLSVEAVGGPGIDTEVMAAELATLNRVAAAIGASLGGGRLFRCGLTTEGFDLIVVRVGSRHALAVAATRGADLRAVQTEMARLALGLAQELG